MTTIVRQLWEIYRLQEHSDDAARIEREYPTILKSEDRSEPQRLSGATISKLENELLKLEYKHDQPSEVTNSKSSDDRKPDGDRVSTPMNLDDETASSLENVSGSHHQSKMLEMPSPEVLAEFEKLLSRMTLSPDDHGSSNNAESSSSLQRQKRVSRMQTY
jgi:hypothetical protein